MLHIDMIVNIKNSVDFRFAIFSSDIFLIEILK